MNLMQVTSLKYALLSTYRSEFFKTLEYYRREEIVLKRFKEETVFVAVGRFFVARQLLQSQRAKKERAKKANNNEVIR